jgi:hypothetical protein
MNMVVSNPGVTTVIIKTGNHSVANMLVEDRKDISVQTSGFKRM